MDDITELAGEGGGGGGDLPFKVFTISATASQGVATVATPQSYLKEIYDYIAGGNTAVAYVELGGDLIELAPAPALSRLVPSGSGIVVFMRAVAVSTKVSAIVLQIAINSEGVAIATVSIQTYPSN